MERKYGLQFLPAVLSPLSVCDGDAAAGLMTYNGALVGCAFAVFLPGQGIGPCSKAFAFSLFRTRITLCYPRRVATGPSFVPG